MRISDYTLRNLRTFCAVVEHSGFGGAQAVLGGSISAISTHLKDLELTLGFTLCHRGRAGFALTEKGEAVYDEAKQLLGSIETCETSLGQLRRVLTGHLRVGIVDSEASNPELPVHLAIRRFFLREQKVRLSLEVGTPETLAKGLQTGELHVAVGPFPQRHLNVEYTPVYVEEHALFCGENHSLFHRPNEDITLAEVSRHPVTVRPYLHKSELAKFRSPIVTASVSNMEAQAMLVRSGCFLGFLPTHFARPWVQQNEMRQIRGLELEWQSQFYVALRARPTPPEIAVIFARDISLELSRVGSSV